MSSYVFTNTDFSHAQPILFKLVDNQQLNTAKEGSCAEIECKVTSSVDGLNANWFWMKDALWSEKNKTFNATIIYSENKSLHPVSPEFATRVKYIGSPSAGWNSHTSPKLCSISICDLNKTDSGIYSFRFLGKEKWVTNSVNLTVQGMYNDQNTKRYFKKIQS